MIRAKLDSIRIMALISPDFMTLVALVCFMVWGYL